MSRLLTAILLLARWRPSTAPAAAVATSVPGAP